MKKLIIILIVFTLITVGSTWILIKMKTDNTSNLTSVTNTMQNTEIGETELILMPTETFAEKPTATIQKNKEKTIDLNAIYIGNNIDIETLKYDTEDPYRKMEIPQIKGLKNKSIEEQINKSIKNKCMESESLYNRVCANFSNVLSINNGCNYNFANGKELEFEDLFTKDADLKNIVRLAIYRGLVEKQRDEIDHYENRISQSEPYYDETDQTWYVDILYRDDEGNYTKTDRKEYAIPMSEYEIEKIVNKFLKSPNKKFYFTSNELVITINDKEYRVYFVDIADEVTIYDKYAVNKSLYEKESKPSSFIACTATKTEYEWTQYESDNFFYSVDISGLKELSNDIDSTRPTKFINKMIDKKLQDVEDKINEYKKISKNNPDKAYFLFLKPVITIGKTSEHYESSTIPTYNSYMPNNIFIEEMQEKLLTCDKKKKEEVLGKIIERYRYYNIGMYGWTFDAITLINTTSVSKIDEKFEEKPETQYYDLFTGKTMKNIKEIFKEDYDMNEVIKEIIKKDYENLLGFPKIDDDFKLKVDKSGFDVYTKDDKYMTHVGYDDVKQYANIGKLKSEILPSNTRMINKDEIEDMTIDELERAYNEIFARHGHEFKSPEYNFYFNLWDWYEPIKGKVVSKEELSEIEKTNCDLIKSVIDEKNK